MTQSYIETPRGDFRLGFETLEAAEAEGWGLWFYHYNDDGTVTAIVAKNNQAVAVSENITF